MELSFNILLFDKKMAAEIPSEWTAISHKMPYCSILLSKLSSESFSAIFSCCITLNLFLCAIL